MNDLPEPWLRRARWCLLTVLLALAACGPGSGGTGTGPLASLYSATGQMGTSVGGVASPSTRIDLQLQDKSVELTTDCGRFVFTGDWAVNAGATVVLPGRFESGTSSTAASLRLQFSEGVSDSRTVTVTLLDANGAVLLGPVALDRKDALAPRGAAGCS